MKPLGIYVHIPFCVRKCHYCDFVSFADMEGLFEPYIDAVIAEAGLYSKYLNDRTADTLFIGGGTPSILPQKLIEKLMRGLRDSFDFRLSEASIEANPESLDEEKLAAYAKRGLGRLSIGLQTHDDEILKRIGRGHTFEGFGRAYETAKKYFDNINIDTIFGLPGQTPEGFIDTILRVINFSPAHVSAYSLKLEEGTKLAQSYKGAEDETDREMYHAAVSLLESAGYEHYETSNFAKKNMRCAHNLKYWRGEEYLGLGVAAHSYLFDDQKQRYENTQSITEYLKAAGEGRKPIAGSTVISEKDEMNEYIMLRLRLREGICFSDFDGRFNSDFKEYFREAIAFSKSNGLITADERGIYPALKGFDLQNTLIYEFMKII